MATMITEVYEAFRAAGAPDDKARQAAEAMAVYDPRLGRIETDVAGIKTDVGAQALRLARVETNVDKLTADVGVLKSDVAVLKWMMGFSLAMLVTLLFKAFVH